MKGVKANKGFRHPYVSEMREPVRKISIICADPDATDSSSDDDDAGGCHLDQQEAEGATSSKIASMESSSSAASLSSISEDEHHHIGLSSPSSVLDACATYEFTGEPGASRNFFCKVKKNTDDILWKGHRDEDRSASEAMNLDGFGTIPLTSDDIMAFAGPFFADDFPMCLDRMEFEELHDVGCLLDDGKRGDDDISTELLNLETDAEAFAWIDF